MRDQTIVFTFRNGGSYPPRQGSMQFQNFGGAELIMILNSKDDLSARVESISRFQAHPSFCRYLISQRPDVEAKIVAELEAEGLLATPLQPKPRDLQLSDLQKLSYLSCVCKVSPSTSHYCQLLFVPSSKDSAQSEGV
jgi:hypothetical protein